MASVTLNGVTREVAIEKLADGTLAVTVDGRRHVVRDVDASAHDLSFVAGDALTVAVVSRTRSVTTLSIAGREYTRAHATADSDRPAASAGGGNGQLTAPMPGAIIAVHVKAGDAVHTGQPLVVLESMKMHNEIVSSINGVVERMNCKVGEQVPYGHVLVEIGATEP